MVLASATSIRAEVATIEQEFNIPPQELKYSLRDVATQAGLELAAKSADLAGKRALDLRGRFTPEQAVRELLSGTGLSAEIHDGAIFVRGRSESAIALAKTDDAENTISVTGTRIAGGPTPSPTIILSRQQMRDAGQNNLGDVIRDLPQNFSGGQNPGVASQGAGLTNQNINGASSINLRGLGPDATLTLINGHRVSYGSFVQSVDIASIPIAAVDRIEIVADGASAIYGSDAVAGVSNVILRDDYSGIDTRARLGKATDGGDFQQQYTFTGGKAWNSGAMLLAYEFDRNTVIRPDQRSYTVYMTEPNALVPAQTHHSVIANAHQDIGDLLTLSADGAYNHRHQFKRITNSSSNTSETQDESYEIAPRIDAHLSERLQASLTGVYARDRTEFAQTSGPLGKPATSRTSGCYCDRLQMVEFDVAGTLFGLPAGDVKIASGGGLRNSGLLDRTTSSSASTSFTRNQRNAFLFGEIFVPLASPELGIEGVNSLSVRGAVRYEDYHRIDHVFTPKIGIVYSPVSGISLKASWGHSFKAPTLLQQYQDTYVQLYPASALGATGVTSKSTVIVAGGGNTDLRPERATNWSATVSLQPSIAPRFSLDLSYFRISYRDRVISPIANLIGAFANPANGQFIIYTPTSSQQSAFIEKAPAGLSNFAGSGYDPSNVYAIVNNRYTNVARQRISGVDLIARYSFDLADGQMSLTANGSYLRSKQQNSTMSQPFDLAGTVFNPPHLSGRLGATWTSNRLVLAGFLNSLDGIRDTRTTTSLDGASMATVDIAVTYRFVEDGVLKGTEIQVAVSNLTDKRPPYLRNTAQYYPNYDSTNYSDVGRLVSVSIGRSW